MSRHPPVPTWKLAVSAECFAQLVRLDALMPGLRGMLHSYYTCLVIHSPLAGVSATAVHCVLARWPALRHVVPLAAFCAWQNQLLGARWAGVSLLLKAAGAAGPIATTVSAYRTPSPLPLPHLVRALCPPRGGCGRGRVLARQAVGSGWHRRDLRGCGSNAVSCWFMHFQCVAMRCREKAWLDIQYCTFLLAVRGTHLSQLVVQLCAQCPQTALPCFCFSHCYVVAGQAILRSVGIRAAAPASTAPTARTAAFAHPWAARQRANDRARS